MANRNESIPMLEAFLQQVDSPSTGVISERLDWPLAIVVFCLIAMTDGPEWTFFAGAFLAWLTLFSIRSVRKNQLGRQRPEVRLAYDRWLRVKRLKQLHSESRLKAAVPTPVIQALEQAARTWHDARQGLHGVSVSNPGFAAEVQTVLDASMSAAVAVCEPVVLRDEQGKKVLQGWEADEDLMSRICFRIQREDERMQQWSVGANGFSGSTPDALRQRLEMAQREREIAEAELDSLL